MAQRLLFQMLGWETSSEKEAEFQAIAKILRVQVGLNESLLGRFSVCNVDSRVRELVLTIDSVLDRGTSASAEMRVPKPRFSAGSLDCACNTLEDGGKCHWRGPNS